MTVSGLGRPYAEDRPSGRPGLSETVVRRRSRNNIAIEASPPVQRLLFPGCRAGALANLVVNDAAPAPHGRPAIITFTFDKEAYRASSRGNT